MKIKKYTDTVQSRSCWGQGAYVIDLCNFKLPTDDTVNFSIMGNEDKYTINMASKDLSVMVSTLVNSDHILIMKQILKEMGEI